jgi:hypothetical protein
MRTKVAKADLSIRAKDMDSLLLKPDAFEGGVVIKIGLVEHIPASSFEPGSP